MAFTFRGSDPEIVRDDTYDCFIHRFRSVDEVPWSAYAASPGTSVRIIIQPSPDRLPLDMLYIPQDNDRLLVGFHGAEAQQSISFPKFQFVTSFRSQREESLLFLADTTILHEPTLSIGWMAGDATVDIAAEYATVIQQLRKAVGINQAVLVGHSAGGTAAIRVSSHLPDSLAVSVNAQLSAALHRPWLVPKIRRAAFPGFSTDAAMLAAYRDRFELFPALAERAEGARFVWFTHAEDSLSFDKYPHFPVLVDYLGLGDQGGITADGDRVHLCRWETSNPNKHALPGTIVPFISEALGEIPALDLGGD